MSSQQIDHNPPETSSLDQEEETADLHTPRRVPMACTFCRKRKIKCDGRKNTCWNCEKRGVVCSYVSVADEQQENLGPPLR